MGGLWLFYPHYSCATNSRAMNVIRYVHSQSRCFHIFFRDLQSFHGRLPRPRLSSGDWQPHHQSRKRKKRWHDESRWSGHDENHFGTHQEWVWKNPPNSASKKGLAWCHISAPRSHHKTSQYKYLKGFLKSTMKHGTHLILPIYGYHIDGIFGIMLIVCCLVIHTHFWIDTQLFRAGPWYRKCIARDVQTHVSGIVRWPCFGQKKRTWAFHGLPIEIHGISPDVWSVGATVCSAVLWPPSTVTFEVIRESIGERRKFWFRLTNRAINEAREGSLKRGPKTSAESTWQWYFAIMMLVWIVFFG